MTKIEELEYLLDTALRRLGTDNAGTKRAIEDAKKKLATFTMNFAPTEGLNPVTLRGVTERGSQEKVNISIGRLGVGPVGEEQNFVTFVVWNGPDNNPQCAATMLISEEKVIEALKLLFNKGELDNQALHIWLAAKTLLQ